MSTESSKRGLAALSPERRREIAASGGRRAHELGHGRQWTREEAGAAARRGGLAVSSRPGHMAQLSRLAAESRRKKAAGTAGEEAAPPRAEPSPPPAATAPATAQDRVQEAARARAAERAAILQRGTAWHAQARQHVHDLAAKEQLPAAAGDAL